MFGQSLTANYNVLVRNDNGSILCLVTHETLLKSLSGELVKVCLSIFATLWAYLPFLFQG